MNIRPLLMTGYERDASPFGSSVTQAPPSRCTLPVLI
jgi:hypothetical protein